MKYLQILIILGLVLPLELHSQNFGWSKVFNGYKNSFGNSIVTDKFGNVYTIGIFEGTIDFDPGPGLHNLTSMTSQGDTYISKLDKDGNFIWVITIQGNFHDGGKEIIESSGFLYISGFFDGTVDFDPGPSVTKLTSNRSGNSFSDIFIMKLDLNGNFIWVKQIGGTDFENPWSIVSDLNGNIYLTGQFAGKVDFDPGPGYHFLTSSASHDVYILKLDNNGNFIWAKQLVGSSRSGANQGIKIRIDQQGNICYIGNFISTVDFDPGAGKFNLTSNGYYDIVICKFDKDGKFLWAKSFGGPSIETAWSFDIDDAGNYYCAGSYFGSVDFDPGPIANIHFGTASNNTFLCKYSTNGDLIWVYDLFCTNISIPNYLIVDHCNDINLFGVYIDTLDFKSKNGVKRLTSFGKFDSYFVRLDSSGNFMQFKGLGNNSNDWVVSVDIDNLNNMYIAGYFSDTINFNNNVIENYHFSLGDYNTFILQLVSCNSQSRHDTIEACDQYTWIDGSTYYHSTDTITYNESNSSCCKVLSKLNLTINKSDTNLIALKGCDSLVINYYKYFESGFYNIISKNVKGCDSITNLKLEIKKSDFIPLNVTTCDSFIWHNTTYQKSGIFNKKFINVHGCDSIETLQLKLNSSSQSSSSIQVCDSYTWNGNTYNTTGNYSYKTQNSFGCDSIANLQLTIFPSHSIQLKVSACDSYTWNGNVYTNSGTYTFNGKNENGCDSIVFLNLIIDTFLYSNEFISSCDQYVWNGKSYNTTGQYRDTFSSINGCDSIVTLNLALNQSKSFIQTQTACDSLLWLGKNYKQSGLYYDTLSTTKGCDSIIKLDLTIHSTKNIKQQKTACDSLEWNGSTYKQSGIYVSKNQTQQSCDSITELELTIHPSTRSILMHSACDSFEWNRNVIKQSGIYTQILSNQYLCDSLVALHIEIFPSTRILDTIHACEEYIDPITGNRITKDEVLSFNQQTEHGCDSVINKVVYIHPQYFYSDTVYTQQNYHWSINNQNYGESGIYTANFQTKEQCDSIYTLYLIIEDNIEIYAPNVIHPGSGIATNKYFYLITTDAIDRIEYLNIYDRWGELVWTKENFGANIPELGWDGNFRAEQMNPAVFVWIAEIRLKNGKQLTLQGDLTVLQ